MPVALRIKLRYPDLDAFVEKFATNVSRGGMFIAARTPKPVDTLLRFELQIADGSPVIAGEGVVRWIREFDERKPRSPHGMGIEFTKLTDGSQAALERIIELRRARGLAEDGIPLQPKSARKSERVATAEPVAESAPPDPAQAAAAEPPTPDAEAEAAPEPAHDDPPEATPVAVPEVASDSTPVDVESAPVIDLTAIAAPSMNLSWSDDALAAILGGSDTALALVEHLARAREIAYGGGGLDTDIDALLEPTATPVASSVADASAALAGLVGAPAVARRAPRREPDGGNGQRRPAVADEPTPEPEPDPEPPEPDPARSTEPPDDDAAPTPDLYAEPDPYIEPDDEDDDDTIEPELADASAAAPPPLEALAGSEPPPLTDDDALAIGTPLPIEPEPSADDEPLPAVADEPAAPVEAAPEPAPDAADYAANGEATFVQSVLPGELLNEPDPSPLPPPTDDDLLAPHDSPLAAVDDPLSHELAVDAMDADDLLASVLDDLPSGAVPTLDLEEDGEYSQPGYTQEGPTNVVEPESTANDAANDGPDEDIDRALAALDLEGDEATEVKDDPGAADAIELDLGELPSDGDGEPGDDPDDPDPKKGFFKRIFGK